MGKSTLFNQLTLTRDALVADYAGLTRDRKYGEGRSGDNGFLDIDTGGVTGDEAGIDAQRRRVAGLKEVLSSAGSGSTGERKSEIRDLLSLSDELVKKSVWIVGGDGWAYDIGFGGLDHVLASGRNVNVLVLNTEVYSNTGGQASKATGLGAVAKFASGGKQTPKKDLGLLAISYGHIYVAKVAMGADDAQTVKAFREAEAFDGPSLIIAYSHCIAHGYDMARGLDQQKLSVNSGHWLLLRFNPDLIDEGRNPLQLDSKMPQTPLKDYYYNENRYDMLRRADPDAADKFLTRAQEIVKKRWGHYKWMAGED